MSQQQPPKSATSQFRLRLSSILGTVIFADWLSMLVLAPLAYGTVEAWSVALFELNALVLAVLLALRLVLKPESHFRFHRLMLPLAAGALLAFAQTLGSTPLSLDPYATRQAAVKLLSLLICFVVSINVLKSRARLRIVFLVATWLGFGLAFFGIMQKLTWNGRLYWVRPISAGVPFGPYVNYNHFAGLMEMLFALPCAWLMFGGVKSEKRGLWSFISVLMAASIVVSLSRGGMLALGIEIISLGIIGRLLRRRWHKSGISRSFAIFSLAAVTVLALWIGYDQVAARWKNLSGTTQELSVGGRLEAWRNSWQMVLDHPLTGVGIGAFPSVYPAYGRSSAYHERLEQTHNDYLQLLTDAGLAGALIGIWFMVELVLLMRRQWQRLVRDGSESGVERAMMIGPLIGIAGLLIHSFTDFNLQITANGLWFLTLTAIAAAFDFKRRD